MTREGIKRLKGLKEDDFLTHILTTVCDYAVLNDYAVTDTVKTIGESLVKLTEICTFDNWKVSEEQEQKIVFCDCENCSRQLEGYECAHCEARFDEKPTQWIPLEGGADHE